MSSVNCAGKSGAHRTRRDKKHCLLSPYLLYCYGSLLTKPGVLVYKISEILIVGVALLLWPSLAAATLPVPSTYPTIQAAIDAAVNGDTVLISDGVYSGTGNRDLDLHGKRVVVRSVNGASVTILDCGGSPAEPHRGFWFHSREDTLSRVEGLTIRNGFGLADLRGGLAGGGAIHCDTASKPRFSECVFSKNRGANGGALATLGSSYPRFYNCVFRQDSAGFGGAIFARGSYLHLGNCVIDSNQADSGGAIGGSRVIVSIVGSSFDANIAQVCGGAVLLDSFALKLDSCSLTNNSATPVQNSQDPFNSYGGALLLRRTGYYVPTFGEFYRSYIRNSSFVNDSAYQGAAIMHDTSAHLSVVNCQFLDNRALGRGGGISTSGSILVDSCSFVGNRATDDWLGFGGGLSIIQGAPTIIRSNFEQNYAAYEGGGIYCQFSSNPSIRGCSFTQNRISIFGGAAVSGHDRDTILIDSCLFDANERSAIYLSHYSFLTLTRSTLFANTAQAAHLGAHIQFYNMSSGTVTNSILASGQVGVAIANFEPAPVFPGMDTTASCTNTDIYGNAGGDWVGGIASQAAINGNLSADPLFCDMNAGDFTLRDNSPCAPPQHPSHTLIGLLGVGCSCCQGVTGNVNLAGEVDISDLSILIAYLTMAPRPPIICPMEANVDTLGAIDLSDLSRLISFLTVPGSELMPCPSID